MEDALSLGNSLSRRLFLSKDAISLLEKNASGKKLLEHYKEFFEKKEILYGHGTGSFVLKNILSSGNIHSDEKLLTGEASTDMITKARETISLVKVDSLHSLFLLELFSFAYEDRKKMVKDFVFKADEGFPVTLFHDISVIQQMKYPEIVKGRVKKMLKMDIIPEKVTQEQIDEAYEKWFRILKGREFFRSKEVEGVLIKALYSLRRSFMKNILPLVSFEGIYTDNITEIVRGLNINTPHTLKQAKFHVLRAIYLSLINSEILTKDILSNQEDYKEYISKECLKLLSDDGPYFSKMLDIKKNKEIFKELENQFPVVLLFKLDNELERDISVNPVMHMSLDTRIIYL